jgi:hypothetical protein
MTIGLARGENRHGCEGLKRPPLMTLVTLEVRLGSNPWIRRVGSWSPPGGDCPARYHFDELAHSVLVSGTDFVGGHRLLKRDGQAER